ADLHLSGKDFQAADIPEAKVTVSPDLTLKVRPGHIDVQGEVKVPEATLAPREISQGAVQVSRDVVIVGGQGQPPPPSAWEVSARIRVVLGDKVNFKGFGLQGQLAGDLAVIDEPGKVTIGRGQISIDNGTYRAYGQDLKIERGRLSFAGSPVDNPGLDVRAVREVGDVTAGVQVTGTAKDPQLTLFSQPAMSQSETLSYLLTGHGLSSASASEGQLLMTAASSMGIKGGNFLAEHIGSIFGLQEARIQSGSTLQESSLVLGKYLSPKLYISYSVGFAEAVNQLQIRYQLSRRWSLQTETGLQTGADLLYTLER
ncbi:MAG TPA: translocation/assembly module TamB domain-containing protein, partial [Gammaproteobacteria bacterium]|nr:translocation/assembly module TamB domain-containing protein [Gammaproteobacteria bacterium]